MPANDTWSCSINLEPLVSMNSASSCDSMVSTNSGFSDDSMEHLSAEERACLMFLEETIESLEAEDDSGVSNDEPDVTSYSQASKVAHSSPISQTKPEEMSSHNNPNKVLGKDQKPNSLLVPTPLVVANGKLEKKANEISSAEQKVAPSNSHHPPVALRAADEPTKSISNPTTSEPMADQSTELADLPPPFIPEPPVKADSSINSNTKDSLPKTDLDPMLDQESKSILADMLMELIPPPSDFMDEPKHAAPVPAQPPKQSQLHPQTQAPAPAQAKPQTQLQAPAQDQAKSQKQPQTQAKALLQTSARPQAEAEKQPQTQAAVQAQGNPQIQPSTLAQAQPQTQPQPQPQLPLQLQSQPPRESMTIAPPPGFGGQDESDKPPSTQAPSSRGPLSPSELDVLRKKASLKKVPEKAPVVVVQPSGQKASNQASFPISCTDGHSTTAVEHSEPKSPPAVAPKPKFPSKIVIKSHKDSGPGHSLVFSSDRMNPQKVHIEALKKLGLLKNDEMDSVPSLSSSPPHRIPPPLAFNTSTCTAPPTGDAAHEIRHAEVEAKGKTNLILPAHPNPEKGGRESPLIPRQQSSKPFEIKSASLKRPSLGTKSAAADHFSVLMSHEKNLEKNHVELSPGQLRKSRPRPASAGSWKELGIDPLLSDSGKEQDIRKSLGSSPIPPPVQPSTDSQGTPRSHGMISVVFTPHSNNGDERKQALRKLGLIRE